MHKVNDLVAKSCPRFSTAARSGADEARGLSAWLSSWLPGAKHEAATKVAVAAVPSPLVVALSFGVTALLRVLPAATGINCGLRSPLREAKGRRIPLGSTFL